MFMLLIHLLSLQTWILFSNDIDVEDNNTTNPLFDQSSKTDQVLEMLDNDEILKSMWPIVKEYSKNMNMSKDGKRSLLFY